MIGQSELLFDFIFFFQFYFVVLPWFGFLLVIDICILILIYRHVFKLVCL